tara:strand:+ start:338 stop:523 length:186 start_codon:yes stop_codon:yes gene_type:complete
MSKKKKLSYYFDFSEVVKYFFRKKDPKRKTNFSLKAMHTVNKMSIIMFLLGILFIIFRRLI